MAESLSYLMIGAALLICLAIILSAVFKLPLLGMPRTRKPSRPPID